MTKSGTRHHQIPSAPKEKGKKRRAPGSGNSSSHSKQLPTPVDSTVVQPPRPVSPSVFAIVPARLTLIVWLGMVPGGSGFLSMAVMCCVNCLMGGGWYFVMCVCLQFQTSFIFYSRHRRAELVALAEAAHEASKSANGGGRGRGRPAKPPKLSFGDLAQQVGADWRSLTVEQQKVSGDHILRS